MLAGLFYWLLRRRETACRRCPHHRDGHKPYAGGVEPGYCGSCGCYQYKPERAWMLALAFLRERPPPVKVDVLQQHPVPFRVRDKGDDGWDENRTQLNIPRWRPYAGALDEARLRVPRPRRRPPW